MDPFSRAAQSHAAGFASKDEREHARACLKSNSKCLTSVSKCVGGNGPCKPRQRQFMREARSSCKEIHDKIYAAADEKCKSACLVQLTGLIGSSTAAREGEVEEYISKLPQNTFETLKRCRRDCQVHHTQEASQYVDCMDSHLLRQMKACLQDNCKDSITDCLASRCDIGQGSPQVASE
mmetsp:Transcript_11212/g.20713  ORF Transcript_11212/g.20713 Transcript_11212/m.20713 type:complete len:179 (+) Transcript_11212:168-704(+)